jgi:hypothetical protein
MVLSTSYYLEKLQESSTYNILSNLSLACSQASKGLNKSSFETSDA